MKYAIRFKRPDAPYEEWNQSHIGFNSYKAADRTRSKMLKSLYLAGWEVPETEIVEIPETFAEEIIKEAK